MDLVGIRSSVDVICWSYYMRCECGRLEVLEAVWMWLDGGTRCRVDMVGWR